MKLLHSKSIKQTNDSKRIKELEVEQISQEIYDVDDQEPIASHFEEPRQ